MKRQGEPGGAILGLLEQRAAHGHTTSGALPAELLLELAMLHRTHDPRIHIGEAYRRACVELVEHLTPDLELEATVDSATRDDGTRRSIVVRLALGSASGRAASLTVRDEPSQDGR